MTLVTLFLFLGLIVFAVMAIQTGILRRAVIYLAVYSLICSLVYLLYGAPDVAIAEAVIGCTLSTILYLVAIKKYQIFTVYYHSTVNDEENTPTLDEERDQINESLTSYVSQIEFQMDLINTKKDLKELIAESSFDVIIIHTKYGIWVHGVKNNYHYEGLVKHFKAHCHLNLNFNYLIEEGGEGI